MTHTKGPWERVDKADYAEIHQKGEGISQAIALVRKEEDADLITCAPELLDALEKMCAWKEAVTLIAPELGGLLKSMYFAEHVISKAKGE